MTVLDNAPRDQYTATSGQTVFPYTFEIAAAGDIKVLQNGTILNQGAGAGEYAVSGVGVDTGGNVTLVTGATTGDIITIYRDMAYERLTAYTNAGDFLAADVNNDFDRLWLALQQNGGDLDGRVLIAPNTDPTSINMTIPDKTARLDKFLKFNATTGNPEVATVTDVYVASGFQNYNFTGNGSTTAFTLGIAPLTENNTQVYIDGVYQEKGTYSVSGTTLTFSTAPPNLSGIEVMVVEVLPSGSNSAANVTFKQAGSSTQRTVQLKLEESISVEDFGAVGDGITDDWAAITAALVNAGSTKWVRLKQGATHMISQTLVFDQSPGTGPKLDGNNATIKAKNTMGDMLRIPSPTSIGANIKDLTIDGDNLATTCLYAVLVTEQNSLFQNVQCKKAVQDGMRLDGCQAMLLQNVISNSNGRHGFLFESCNATTANSIRAVQNVGAGVLIQPGAQFGYTSGMQLYGVDAELNGAHGISVIGTTSPVVITGSWLESNTGDGVNVSGTASGVIIKDNGIIGGVVLGDRAVRLGASTVGCTVTDNRFQTAGGGAADPAYIQVVNNGTGFPNDTYPNYIRSSGKVIGEDVSFAPIRQTQVAGVSGMLSGGVAISIPSSGSKTFTFTPSGSYLIGGAGDRGAYFLELDFVGYFAGIDQTAMARYQIYAGTMAGLLYDGSATKEFEVGDTARMTNLTVAAPIIVGATNAFTVVFSNADVNSFDGYFTWRSVSTTTDLSVTVV